MPRPAKQTPAQILAMIREQAPALREAGVLELELDGWRVMLAPPAPVLAADTATDAPSPPMPDLDPLNDPATWGMPAGARPPGFKDRVNRSEEP
jgi:hypothetical protein